MTFQPAKISVDDNTNEDNNRGFKSWILGCIRMITCKPRNNLSKQENNKNGFFEKNDIKKLIELTGFKKDDKKKFNIFLQQL